jgi:FlaA1/EpsC-like NDP-sugar epimerase
VATQLVKNSGKNVRIEVVGLRVGEKVHEELFGDGELDQRPSHPLISQVAVKPISQSGLRQAPEDARNFMLSLLEEQ